MSIDSSLYSLRRFRRVRLEPGETADVTFRLRPEDMSLFDDEGNELVEPREFTVSVGGR